MAQVLEYLRSIAAALVTLAEAWQGEIAEV